ncbi:peptidylprolyl isomerase [Microlunatus endophyticus]|uniref:peptidylprolyl isomerase n=1 Tax=Microlunatus endophyticus TaxID=1716077 RepID=A0A917S0E4_9ACTN|nr:FKBP-type peptidyl-prolyl cis-trans isomerase [Microlunatus endophyticus]GGL49812.1 peptidylprolyl isomerase [Microlunatus endophyticus]
MTPSLHLPLSIRTRRSSGVAVRALVVGAVATSVALLGACGNDNSANAGKSPSASASAKSSASPSATTSASPSPSATPTVKPSTNLDAIKVKGSYGKAPKITVKHPWAINKTQSKVLSKGKGAKVTGTATVGVDYSGWDGRTGKEFDSSFDKSFGHQQTTYFPLDQVVAGFKKGLQGHHVGDRVLIAMTGKDGYDSSGGNAQAGINVGDSLIFVVDIESATLPSATGTTVKPKSGLPTVTMVDNAPKVTIPSTAAPTKTTVQPLIKGTGAKVKSTDLVTTRSVTVLWNGGKVVDNSWKTPFAPQQDPSTGAVTPTRLKAMQTAMVGQPVGSRLLIVFPPGKGYPNGDKSQGIAKTDTVVMVVDILFTQPAQ